ncbi:Flp family type IVb pilin [Pseudomonas sp. SP16.1]|uniref:Flp family type IVb pilin n=1 Tax=Pseudomonas sp. SP16.1 TaxID=3458854 RepID=UPI0040457A1C
MTFQAIKTSVMKFVEDEDGLTIVEYAIAGGLIALGVVAAFITLGQNVDTQITALSDCVGATAGGGGGGTCPQ